MYITYNYIIIIYIYNYTIILLQFIYNDVYLDGSNDFRFNFPVTFLLLPLNFTAVLVLANHGASVALVHHVQVAVEYVTGAARARVHVRFGERVAVKLRQAVDDADLALGGCPFRAHLGPVDPVVRIHRALLLLQDERSAVGLVLVHRALRHARRVFRTLDVP